jgi:cell wall-associated NlpC family hydrolase
MNTNVVTIARECIGRARYCFESEFSDPPRVVNCYTFVAWAFSECGVAVPSSLEGQLYRGVPVDPTDLQDGDLLFTTGRNRNFFTDSGRAVQGVGHVGFLTVRQTVIHASQRHGTVIETPLTELFHKLKFRGVYRIDR